MDPNATILRVKRKRGTDPADALLLACKRIRPETSQSPGETVPEPSEAEVESSVFKLVATVATQDAPVETQVRQALARPRVAHALRPSAGSSHRIIGKLRNAKWSTRREERYKIISRSRTELLDSPEPQETVADVLVEETVKRHKCPGQIQVVDLLHEDEEDQGVSPSKVLPSDTEAIMCNNTKMLRQRLNISGDGLREQNWDQDSEYVYDLYYQEMATPGWIQDILSVRAYADEGELVPDLVVHEEEVYDDEDDENDEANWRNDYPDESDSEGDKEERYGAYWEEEHSYSQGTWHQYQRDLLRELSCCDERDDEDDGGCTYDSD
ncbi:probable RNA polymerase II nuclear localization protein SLC7A6OS [Takifugu rubripes]|uniref:Probable RNA polymerase II nuclear localization protein SLC7A6OS n=1 Tax=Takifugu rubripes TaxID=31033 RepID=A0A674MCY5_TAKRU|nr:probable RNA polymerase II nuclear localization protein SLC7A6OS [Takifugu rubripes]XP_029701888.1 probable RNA polymerase II nuclear localization protein SLC7A6OS [Takifugu rubripes]|eukprot:XP_003977409.1 PREDICTED: probable RNA polymerase II nuclear localization protein SLC7A6OS [Takifugu rubripes]